MGYIRFRSGSSLEVCWPGPMNILRLVAALMDVQILRLVILSLPWWTRFPGASVACRKEQNFAQNHNMFETQLVPLSCELMAQRKHAQVILSGSFYFLVPWAFAFLVVHASTFHVEHKQDMGNQNGSIKKKLFTPTVTFLSLLGLQDYAANKALRDMKHKGKDMHELCRVALNTAPPSLFDWWWFDLWW